MYAFHQCEYPSHTHLPSSAIEAPIETLVLPLIETLVVSLVVSLIVTLVTSPVISVVVGFLSFAVFVVLPKVTENGTANQTRSACSQCCAHPYPVLFLEWLLLLSTCTTEEAPVLWRIRTLISPTQVSAWRCIAIASRWSITGWRGWIVRGLVPW